MTFRIKNLTVKNFMSVGNQTQALYLDRTDLTLVLGENQDVGGSDTGARNGTGKTTIINALSYALYGTALTNIKKENLINKTNNKAMLVTVEFERDGQKYRIERGRKPNVLKFFVGEHEHEPTDDTSQGDSRETQAEIERLLSMSHDMFKHIVALNTYTEPFLSMRANDQRAIIEQLLGITKLSTKAESLKEQLKTTKGLVQEEEYQIKSIQNANSKIQDQIEGLTRRRRLWTEKHNTSVLDLTTALKELSNIDIESEIQNHMLQFEIRQKQDRANTAKKWIQSIEQSTRKINKDIDCYNLELSAIKDHKCHSCGQDIHDEKQEEIYKSKKNSIAESSSQLLLNEKQHAEWTKELETIGDIPPVPTTMYSRLDEAQEHKSTLSSLQDQIVKLKDEVDPYSEQIYEMEHKALEKIDYTKINEFKRLQDHQEFLMKLLTNKDSFIRKRIIDQNLSFLNSRLKYYLNNLGLPHSVEFKNDLTVEIQELGRDLDFDNLSRGERNRLILSMSWSFRDVWENLYHPINLLFVDELMDSGLDSIGIENALSALKKIARERKKSVWLVSHKDELVGRVNNIQMVIKSGGFTEYANDVEST